MKNIIYALVFFISFSTASFAENYGIPVYQTNSIGTNNTNSNNNYILPTNQATYLPGVAYQPFVNVDLGWNQHTLESLKYSPIGMSLIQQQAQVQRPVTYYGRPAYRSGY